MSQEILNSVLAIESEAKALKEKFDEKLSETKAATDQRVNEAKSNMEQSLEVYVKELKEKNQQKRVAFEAKVKEEEKAEIHALTERFNHLKQDLVQDTVKEVLKRYGDS